MAWTDEVHEHRVRVERGRARLRSQGVQVSGENRADFLPLAVVVAVLVGLGWWRREGHKLRRSAFPGAGLLARVMGRGEDAPRRNAVEAARRRLQGQGGSSSSQATRAASQKPNEKAQKKKSKKKRK